MLLFIFFSCRPAIKLNKICDKRKTIQAHNWCENWAGRFMVPNQMRVSQVLFWCSAQVYTGLVRWVGATCACSRYCSWNFEIQLFANYTIVSIKELGMNKLKDSKESSRERAVFLNPGMFCKMFLFESLPELWQLFSQNVSYSNWKHFEGFE